MHRITVIAAMWVIAGTAAPQDIEVVGELEITEGLGGFTGDLDNLDLFGWSAATIGDLDGDGRPELAVGAPLDDDGGGNTGAVWILFLSSDGTVAKHQKISATKGNLSGFLAGDRFGSSIAALGDMDGDGVPDIAVGARTDDDAGASGCPGAGCSSGSVTILFLNADGTVKGQRKISRVDGGFPVDFATYGKNFGASVEAIGDVNGDGVVDLIVGMPVYSICSCVDPQHPEDTTGSAWIVLLNPDATVLDAVLIANGLNGFPEDGIADHELFGSGVAHIGDLDGDGVPDVAVNAPQADDGAVGNCSDLSDYHICNTGAIWILFLNPDGTVRAHQKVSKTTGAFPFPLDDGDYMGSGMARAGDLDADGIPDLIAAASGDDDGCVDCGAVYVLYMRRDGTVKTGRKFSMLSGGLQGPLEIEAFFGATVDVLGDFQGDGVPDLVVGATSDDSGQFNAGSIRLLFLDSDLARYGCASPEASLLILGGAPRLGTRITFGLRNPFESQGTGSLSFLLGATAPAPFFPCGFLVPGFGMDPTDPVGELLIDLFLPPNPVLVLPGPALTAPDDRAEIQIDIPVDPALDGLELYFQGALLDISPAASIRRGLTEGLRLRLHS
jgi:hypothetical protein